MDPDYYKQALDDCRKLSEGHVGARQMFPFFWHDRPFTPTIKHACDKCELSAMLRAGSCQVSPNPVIAKKFIEYLETKYADRS